jgi:uncharacterized protein Yka (UPF0111/DUF47 family)
MLRKVNEALKKFGNVNKKAVYQFNSFTNQLGDLEKRCEELKSSGEAIKDLIQNLDKRKNEAIQQTFKRVAKNSKHEWEGLVLAGFGRLEMGKSGSGLWIDGSPFLSRKCLKNLFKNDKSSSNLLHFIVIVRNVSLKSLYRKREPSIPIQKSFVICKR